MIMLSCGDCCCKEILQFCKACQAVNGLDILQTILAIPNKIRMARILKCYLSCNVQCTYSFSHMLEEAG